MFVPDVLSFPFTAHVHLYLYTGSVDRGTLHVVLTINRLFSEVLRSEFRCKLGTKPEWTGVINVTRPPWQSPPKLASSVPPSPPIDIDLEYGTLGTCGTREPVELTMTWPRMSITVHDATVISLPILEFREMYVMGPLSKLIYPSTKRSMVLALVSSLVACVSQLGG